MKKWSTVDDTITCGFPLSGLKELKITYNQRGKTVLTRTQDDVSIDETNNIISFTWKQSDWTNFTSGRFTFDVTVVYNNGEEDRIDTERFVGFVEVPNLNEVV